MSSSMSLGRAQGGFPKKGMVEELVKCELVAFLVMFASHACKHFVLGTTFLLLGVMNHQ